METPSDPSSPSSSEPVEPAESQTDLLDFLNSLGFEGSRQSPSRSESPVPQPPDGSGTTGSGPTPVESPTPSPQVDPPASGEESATANRPFPSFDNLVPTSLSSFEDAEPMDAPDGLALKAESGPDDFENLPREPEDASREADNRDNGWPASPASVETPGGSPDSAEVQSVTGSNPEETAIAGAPELRPEETAVSEPNAVDESNDEIIEFENGVASVTFSPESDFDLSALEELSWDRGEDDLGGFPDTETDREEEVAEAAQPAGVASSHPPEKILDVHCPSCEKVLSLRNENLGIEGECVWCQTPIVAAASGLDGKVRVFRVVSPQDEGSTSGLETETPDPDEPESPEAGFQEEESQSSIPIPAPAATPEITSPASGFPEDIGGEPDETREPAVRESPPLAVPSVESGDAEPPEEPPWQSSVDDVIGAPTAPASATSDETTGESIVEVPPADPPESGPVPLEDPGPEREKIEAAAPWPPPTPEAGALADSPFHSPSTDPTEGTNSAWPPPSDNEAAEPASTDPPLPAGNAPANASDDVAFPWPDAGQFSGIDASFASEPADSPFDLPSTPQREPASEKEDSDVSPPPNAEDGPGTPPRDDDADTFVSTDKLSGPDLTKGGGWPLPTTVSEPDAPLETAESPERSASLFSPTPNAPSVPEEASKTEPPSDQSDSTPESRPGDDLGTPAEILPDKPQAAPVSEAAAASPFPRRQLMAPDPSPAASEVPPSNPDPHVPVDSPFPPADAVPQNPISAAVSHQAGAAGSAPANLEPSAQKPRTPKKSGGKTIVIGVVLVGLIFGVGAGSFLLPDVLVKIDDAIRQHGGGVKPESVWPAPGASETPVASNDPAEEQENAAPPDAGVGNVGDKTVSPN